MQFSLAIVITYASILGVSAAPFQNTSSLEARGWPWSTTHISFAQCSSPQQSQVKDAVKHANSYISDAIKHLTKISKTGSLTERYMTWFGRYSANNVQTVLEHFEDIKNKPSRVTYHCKHDLPDCTSTAGAFVRPHQTGDVYLCDAFWGRPTAGAHSKAATIVHEFTHFLDYGGTKDHVYGPTAAKALARSSPARAISNADNHEFFAVNIR